MALLWVDGFEKYGLSGNSVTPSETINWKYTSTLFASLSIDTGFTNNCLKLNSSTSGVKPPNLTSNRTMICGFAFKARDVDAGLRLVDFRHPNNAGETVGYGEFYLQIASVNSANEVRLYRGNTSIATSNGVDIQPDTWYYLEVKVYCDSSSGTCNVRLDENEVISFSGNTHHRATAGYDFYSTVLFYPAAPDVLYIDDLYICDGSGSDNNDFLGTCNVETISPSADASGNWTPSTGADMYAVVDEAEAGSDYISETTTGNQALFELENLSTSGTVVGAMITCESEISGNLNKYAKFLTQNGSGGSIQEEGHFPPGAERPHAGTVIMEKDPDGNAWSSAIVNDLRVGVELS
jgi:hypothetical protein